MSAVTRSRSGSTQSGVGVGSESDPVSDYEPASSSGLKVESEYSEAWERPSHTGDRVARRFDRQRRPYLRGQNSSPMPESIEKPMRPHALPSPTPYEDSASGLKARIEATGACFEKSPPVRLHAHAAKVEASGAKISDSVTIYLGGSRYHPQPRSEDSPNVHSLVYNEPFFASRTFGPPNISSHQRVGLKAIAEEIVSYLRQVGKEFGGFPKPVFEDPLPEDDDRQDSKRKGGAPCIMLVFAAILETILNCL
jgi:hypothetical protein